MEFHPMRALFMIAKNGVIPLNEPNKWTSEFQELMNSLLCREWDSRPSAEDILNVLSKKINRIVILLVFILEKIFNACKNCKVD